MISKIFKIINSEDEVFDNDFDHNYVKLINRYLIFLFLLFLFYSVFIILFFGDAVSSTFLIFITGFWFFLIFLKGKISKFRKVLKVTIIAVFIILTLIVSFFYVYTSRDAGVEYFYFSLLFALPFYFDYREDYRLILAIVIIIALNFIGCLFLELNFLPKSEYIKKEDFKIIRLLNIIFSFTTFLIDAFFIYQKDKLINGLMRETEIKDSTIEDLLKANNELMKQQIITNNLTEDNIAEILELADMDSPLFLDKFQAYFPDFMPNLLNINSGLISSEIHICALMRLNFDTKKIALCTNSSVRAIESRKYRIRKKLDIPSEININNFILKI
ncbi:helix-turn-helix transcriptional regulator [Chryseobacterium sp. MIQD13]|uniref:helix-turn-helix transcriptional regulator n=1 Tax=Chryseobacterium sp. MIQD13 TaxID=3422310 RepID=UPI003D2B2676